MWCRCGILWFLRELNYSEAANRLFMTQSSLSKSIKKWKPISMRCFLTGPPAMYA